MTLMPLIKSPRDSSLNQWLISCLLIITIMVISGCAGNRPLSLSSPSQDQTGTAEQRMETRERSLDDILAQTGYQDLKHFPDIALDALIAAAQEQRWTQAETLLSIIETKDFTADMLAEYSLAALRLWMHNQQYTDASHWLNSAELQFQIALMKTEDQLSLSMLRADVLYELGSYSASAQERIFIEDLLTDSDIKDANLKAIWKSLIKIPPEQLKAQHSRAVSSSYRAWLELASIHHSNDIDVAEQVSRVQDWQQRWPRHQASDNIPLSIDALQFLATERPRSIAALLPLSGPLASGGKAVQDGLAAAYFTAMRQGWELPTLTTYDTHSLSIGQLYEQAIMDGADFIIGPLQKDKVSELLTMPTSVPIITLNYVTNGMPPPVNVIQYGLAAEDEAVQLARAARIADHQNVLLLQSGAGWARRASQAFITHWQQTGGKIIHQTVLSDPKNYSHEIADALLLPISTARQKRLQNIMGTRFEFTPRRRSDIDVIILFANSQQAKSIKPLLSYHYASNIPVYSSSRVNDGSTHSNENRDLNGIIFNEIPWVVETNPIKQQAAERYRNNKSLGRLFAMGVDAFYLHPRLNQLQQAPDSQINGLTGKLSLQENRVVRELVMTTFSAGKTKIIPNPN